MMIRGHGQSRRMSAAETLLGQFVGFVVAWVAWIILLPVFGYTATATKAFTLTLIFTVLSIIRGYLWRRLFNWLHARGIN